ncbi:MAG: hypothetical protein LC797_10410 [Chloroflexi bacterium]|nr:hypothetical protein [Chloroflexota bacterium]
MRIVMSGEPQRIGALDRDQVVGYPRRAQYLDYAGEAATGASAPRAQAGF